MEDRFSRCMVVLVVMMINGCVSEPPGGGVKNGVPETQQVTTAPPAPMQVYLKVGQSEQFTYWGHSIAINYTSSYPMQIVKVTVDGKEKNVEVDLTADPKGIYWKEANLSFALKPVVWEIRDGQRIPFYEKTWNTTEVYFEVVR